MASLIRRGVGPYVVRLQLQGAGWGVGPYVVRLQLQGAGWGMGPYVGRLQLQGAGWGMGPYVVRLQQQGAGSRIPEAHTVLRNAHSRAMLAAAARGRNGVSARPPCGASDLALGFEGRGFRWGHIRGPCPSPLRAGAREAAGPEVAAAQGEKSPK
ncbi:hypothetical protein ACRRTK_019174 [Alexandromys fortis]